VDPILHNEDLTAFTKRAFAGRLSFDGSATVSVHLQDDCGLRIAGEFGEVLVPYEAIARSQLWRDSFGAIRITMGHLQILLDIEPTGDGLALLVRLQEWMASFSAGADGHNLPTPDSLDE
jgi:hypothetical protein